MNTLEISFPQGAGGHWLANLISCLADNYPININNSLESNFHNVYISPNIKKTHEQLDHGLSFNGTYYFNMFVNYVKKTNYSLADSTQYNLYETKISQATYILTYQRFRTDVNFDLIYTNPEQFIIDLYKFLDQINFEYTKNNQTCLNAISNFKQIGHPVGPIYDNWEDEIWLFWCLGISKFEFQSWPDIENATDLVEFLYPKRQYFLDYTQKRMI